MNNVLERFEGKLRDGLVKLLNKPAISNNADISTRFLNLLDATAFARGGKYDCLSCINTGRDYPRGLRESEYRSVINAIKDNFGFSLDEINKALGQSLMGEENIRDCISPDQLCEAIAKIILEKGESLVLPNIS